MTDTPSEQPDTPPDARQPVFRGMENRLLIIRILLTIILLAVYYLSGASDRLAHGLEATFGDAWWAVDAVYIAVTLLGYSAFLFPLSLYGDFAVSEALSAEPLSLGLWVREYFKIMIFEILLACAALLLVYALLHWFPVMWWLWAAAVYILFTVLLTTLSPYLMPLFQQQLPIRNMELAGKLQSFMERQGIRVLGVYEWNDPDEALTANAVLAGLGRTRRVLLTSTLLRNYCEEEIQAVLAHEIAHYRRHDLWRHIVMGVLFSLICFLAVHHTLHNLLPFTGIRGIADIRSLPLLLMCVFIFSLLLMPLANTYARRLELAADHQAIHIMGSADPVISAMKHMAEDNMLEKQPSAWAEWLLHSHPSVTRRIARARQAEQQMKQ